MIYILAV